MYDIYNDTLHVTVFIDCQSACAPGGAPDTVVLPVRDVEPSMGDAETCLDMNIPTPSRSLEYDTPDYANMLIQRLPSRRQHGNVSSDVSVQS